MLSSTECQYSLRLRTLPHTLCRSRTHGCNLPSEWVPASTSLQERASGMYRLSAFYVARSLSDMPMELTIPTVFVILVYLMVRPRCKAS